MRCALVSLFALSVFAIPSRPAVAQDGISGFEMQGQKLKIKADYSKLQPAEALAIAVANGDAVQAARAVRRGAQINQREPIFGATQLIMASWRQSPAFVKNLLALGADANARGSDGVLPNVPLAMSRRFPKGDWNSDHLDRFMNETLRVMQSVPMHWNYFKPSGRGLTPLMAAAAANSPDNVQILLSKGAEPRERAASGENALMAAAYAGNMPIVEALIKEGVPVDVANNFGATALTFAVLEGRKQVARRLLHAGADPTVKLDGYTLPQVARFLGYDDVAGVIENYSRWALNSGKIVRPGEGHKAPRSPVRIIGFDGSVEVAR